MDKFIKYCKDNHITCGFIHRIDDDMFKTYQKALEKNLIEISFSPYGDMFSIKDSYDKYNRYD